MLVKGLRHIAISTVVTAMLAAPLASVSLVTLSSPAFAQDIDAPHKAKPGKPKGKYKAGWKKAQKGTLKKGKRYGKKGHDKAVDTSADAKQDVNGGAPVAEVNVNAKATSDDSQGQTEEIKDRTPRETRGNNTSEANASSKANAKSDSERGEPGAGLGAKSVSKSKKKKKKRGSVPNWLAPLPANTFSDSDLAPERSVRPRTRSG